MKTPNQLIELNVKHTGLSLDYAEDFEYDVVSGDGQVGVHARVADKQVYFFVSFIASDFYFEDGVSQFDHLEIDILEVDSEPDGDNLESYAGGNNDIEFLLSYVSHWIMEEINK